MAGQSPAGNQHQLMQPWNYLPNAIYPRGAATCKETLLLMSTAFPPRWSEGALALRPLVGSKGAVGKWVLTITSFTDMTILTSTQRPAEGTIIPGSREGLGRMFSEAEVWDREMERCQTHKRINPGSS